ncbi:MAG TPA: amidohydrolase family protein [Candidatus Saccharimonadales bacterium]|nr:amidohydrolase family protein [Candidatus Saccharimonadales bacterium]
MTAPRSISRREFLVTSALALAATESGCETSAPSAEPIIDIHQHCHYGGKRDAQWRQIGPARTDAQLIAHQRNMGVAQTILLPAGQPCLRASTHQGFSNGLEGTCTGNEACAALAEAHREMFRFGANEVPDLEEARVTIEKYLKKGAIVIAEQKFGVECDSPQMQDLYRLAADYGVPILMHWQYGTYNYGYDRFDKMLQKYSSTIFVGHAQTFWAHIDQNYQDDSKHLYPSGKVTPGGRTDRYLTDYPNFVGDLSAESGHNALARDPEFTRGFFTRHQDKLVFGSDCSDRVGGDNTCTGWNTIQTIRQLAPSKAIERKLLHDNAKKLYRL